VAQSLEDEQLLASFKDTKNISHLGQLYQKYMPLVYGTSLKYLKNTQDAEDCVIEIFEKISKKIPNSEVKNFKSWLYVVAKNHCFEILRRRKTRFDKESEAEIMYSEDVFHPDDIDNQNDISRLTDCIQRLDRKQRACIDLFYFKKLTYAEVAEALDIGYSQVRSRIQNGRRNLKICMENTVR
jgi:RNA polymerase sigma-70 factor (ECF subfamily)